MNSTKNLPLDPRSFAVIPNTGDDIYCSNCLQRLTIVICLKCKRIMRLAKSCK